MSVRAMSEVFRYRGLRPAPRLVLLKLADQADDHGHVWLGAKAIAGDVEISLRSVRGILAELRSSGLIEELYKGGGRHRTTLYRILPFVLPDSADCDRVAKYERQHRVSVKGANRAPLPIGAKGCADERERVKLDAGNSEAEFTRHIRTPKNTPAEPELVSSAQAQPAPKREGESWGDWLRRTNTEETE